MHIIDLTQRVAKQCNEMSSLWNIIRICTWLLCVYISIQSKNIVSKDDDDLLRENNYNKKTRQKKVL